MIIKVKLFANLRKYFPDQALGSPKTMQIDPGLSIAELYEKLDIPIEEIKLAYVNGIYCEPEYILQDGDEIGIFPPIGGGVR